MTELKKVSDMERDFLSALGETPAEHQKQLLDRVWKKTYGSSHSTRKKSEHELERERRLSLNREVERRLTATEPVGRVVERMKAPEIQWVPDAYIIFIRKWRCDCGVKGSCLDQPTLFLRHHALKKSDPEHSRLYVPTRNIELPSLPRLREIRFCHLHVCENCLETAACQTKPLPSSPVATESCGPLASTAPTLAPLSNSLPNSAFEPSSSEGANDGSTILISSPSLESLLQDNGSSMNPGSDSVESVPASPAPVVA